MLQVPLGSTFKDPGYFAQSVAVGKSSPVIFTATLSGTIALLSQQCNVLHVCTVLNSTACLHLH